MNPGDKKAEEKFKEMSEANDILSDPKKRKIYDQLGFYSDNIDPAAAEAAAQGGYGFRGDPRDARQGPQQRGSGPVGFEGFDFSDFSGGAQRSGTGSRAGTGGTTPEGQLRGEDFEIFFPACSTVTSRKPVRSPVAISNIR